MEWKNKPFNDVVDYFNKVEGNASNIGKAKGFVTGTPRKILFHKMFHRRNSNRYIGMKIDSGKGFLNGHSSHFIDSIH